jgi:hypothetical protein
MIWMGLRAYENRQQHELMAKASKVETAISIKRWIMMGMLGTRSCLAMKKKAEKCIHFLPRDFA